MASPHVAAVAARCYTTGACTSTTSSERAKLMRSASTFNQANPGFGYATGFTLSDVNGQRAPLPSLKAVYGSLIWGNAY